MSLVVLLRGVNVGGHKTFRPSVLVRELELDAVSIGAAGTFVIRTPIARMKLRAEMAHRLPFVTDIVICPGSEILQLASADPFAGQPSGPKFLHFVSVMAKQKQAPAQMPLVIPNARDWGMKILDVRGRFVVGLCRREMKAIGYLGQVEKILGVSGTMRSWNTILRIAKELS